MRLLGGKRLQKGHDDNHESLVQQLCNLVSPISTIVTWVFPSQGWLFLHLGQLCTGHLRADSGAAKPSRRIASCPRYVHFNDLGTNPGCRIDVDENSQVFRQRCDIGYSLHHHDTRGCSPPDLILFALSSRQAKVVPRSRHVGETI